MYVQIIIKYIRTFFVTINYKYYMPDLVTSSRGGGGVPVCDINFGIMPLDLDNVKIYMASI